MLSVSTPPETCPEENNGHSHNTQTYPHGESYAGECKNGLRHGKGIYYFSDGSWVQGTWENDKLSGNATFTMLSTSGRIRELFAEQPEKAVE